MIITEALDFVESEEMRAHLETTELPSSSEYILLICEAPLPITQKLQALKTIAEKYDLDGEPSIVRKCSVHLKVCRLIEDASKALKELTKPTPGSIFSLTYVERENNGGHGIKA